MNKLTNYHINRSCLVEGPPKLDSFSIINTNKQHKKIKILRKKWLGLCEKYSRGIHL